jgi:hypothetical protein
VSLLDDLASVIGTPGAKALCSVWGGRRLYIAQEPSADSAIVELLGELQAAKLAARYGGERIELPLPDVAAARRVEAQRLFEEGYSIAGIAAELNVTRAWARRLLFLGQRNEYPLTAPSRVPDAL